MITVSNTWLHIPLKDPVVDLNLKPKENWDTRINNGNEKALNIFRKCISCERPQSLHVDRNGTLCF